MKAILNKILRWLNFTIIAVMLGLVLLILGLYFVSNHFTAYHARFEQFISDVVQQPIQIGKVTLGSHGLEPALRLHHIVILNHTKTKKLLEARELQIGIDLIGSLIKWQIKPGLLLIRGSTITLAQDKSGKVNIVGIAPLATPTTDTTSTLHEISSWLFEQSRIDLKDIVLKFQRANGQIIKFTDLYLKLHNGVLQHELKIRGKFQQHKSPALFTANLQVHGDILKQPVFPVKGEVAIENWVPEVATWNFAASNNLLIPTGDIRLSIKHSKIATKIWRQPLAINNLEGRVFWQHDSKGLKVSINKLNFMDNWLTLSGDSQLFFPANSQLPIVDIRLGLKLLNLAKVKLYYPVTLIPADALRWLDQAFISSKLISGNILLQGPLDKFPFDQNEGKFLVDTNIRDVCLNYDAQWPRIDNITGKMIFEGRAMTILAPYAKIMREPTKLIKATIPDLELPILHIVGAMDANSNTGLKFIAASPLKNSIGKKLQDLSLTGLMKLRLEFDMPLADELADQATRVDGNIELADNYLASNSWDFGIENLKGNLHFDSDTLVAPYLSGKLFDQPVELTIATVTAKHKDPITRVSIKGKAKIQDCEQAFMVKLSPYLYGDFAYHAMLDLPSSAAQNVFTLSSNLQGVEVKLPPPFTKPAKAPSLFELTGYFGGSKTSQLEINYNNQITAALAIKKAGTKNLQLVGGEIKFGPSPAKMPATNGLVITGKLAKLDWGVWKNYFAPLQTNIGAARSIINQVHLTIDELHAVGQIFKQTLVKASPHKKGWEVACVMPDIEGKIYVPADSKEAIRGEFKKLYLGKAHQELAAFKPQELPPLNFEISDFHYDNQSFSHVAFITEPQTNGVKISKAIINGPQFAIKGSGNWMAGGNKQNVFRGKISSGNIGELLKQWELTTNVMGGKGEASFELKWPTALYKPTLPTVSGMFTININNGRIINLSRQTESKLGLGKILNMLSLQSLPRRLALDFSDLTQKGFAFDTMEGNFELTEGMVTVQKLTLYGMLAHVEAYGTIGLKNQDYNIMLSVVPHIATSIPVVTTAAILGGPVVGVVSLIADNILSTVSSKMVKKATNYNYQVTGPWENPTITKL